MVNVQSFEEDKIQLISIHLLDVENDSYMNLFWALEDAIQEINSNVSSAVVLVDLSDVILKPKSLGVGYESYFISDLISGIKFPTIGIVDSEAHLALLELFLCFDIRITNRKSRFSMSHILEGFTPTDGGTQRLPRIVGVGRAMDLLLTGRCFSAEEAMEIGVVQYIFPKDVVGEAIALGSQIAAHGPIAAQYLKEAIMNGADMTLSQGLSLETDLNVILQSTFDRAEGIQSFLNKKSPKFLGR